MKTCALCSVAADHQDVAMCWGCGRQVCAACIKDHIEPCTEQARRLFGRARAGLVYARAMKNGGRR